MARSQTLNARRTRQAERIAQAALASPVTLEIVGDISELSLVVEVNASDSTSGQTAHLCPECGSPTEIILRNYQEFRVCQDALREAPLCGWHEAVTAP